MRKAFRGCKERGAGLRASSEGTCSKLSHGLGEALHEIGRSAGRARIRHQCLRCAPGRFPDILKACLDLLTVWQSKRGRDVVALIVYKAGERIRLNGGRQEG